MTELGPVSASLEAELLEEVRPRVFVPKSTVVKDACKDERREIKGFIS